MRYDDPDDESELPAFLDRWGGLPWPLMGRALAALAAVEHLDRGAGAVDLVQLGHELRELVDPRGGDTRARRLIDRALAEVARGRLEFCTSTGQWAGPALPSVSRRARA